MGRGCTLLAIVGLLTSFMVDETRAQMRGPSANEPPTLEETPASPINQPGAKPPSPDESPRTKEKLARVWANEPPLVRLARNKFGAELTETDAKFFNAVSTNYWADFRTSADTKYDPEEPTTWASSPKLNADRINWLCSDSSAAKLVPAHRIWLRGVIIEGEVSLYRCDVPFSLAFYDCLLIDGLDIRHAKLQDLDLRNSCSRSIQARGAQIAENVYLFTTAVYGGLDFIDSQIGGDFDFSGGLATHPTNADDSPTGAVAINFHDAKVAGDLKLGDKFRAIGQVRLIGAQIGRSLTCTGKFAGGDNHAIDARRTNITGNAVFTSGCRAEGGLQLRRARIGGDLDCNGGRFIAAPDTRAVDVEMVNVGSQVILSDGFHAEGEVFLTNAVVGGDVACNNGHFLNPKGNALCLDGAVIGRSLRLCTDANATADDAADLPAGFLARGTVSLVGAQVSQDITANSGQFECPGGNAIMASNVRVGSRLDLTCLHAQGLVSLFSTDIEHELDMRCSHFDAKGAADNIAIWANGMHVRGHVYCQQVDGPEETNHLHVNGVASFQFATIAMHWNLAGAKFINSGGDALDASDCRVGGYVNLDSVAIDGRASFSRAKIDGMWIINKMVEPQKTRLDMRFAHIWVIKDEKLDDWPPAGQLQLEGLVYDHFDDDSPLDVNDRLAWLRRQYAPRVAVPGASPNPAESANNKSHVRSGLETFGQSQVRGRETPAQRETRAQRARIIPAQFSAPATPVPQMAAPMPIPMPMYTVPPTTLAPEAPHPVTPPPESTAIPSTIGAESVEPPDELAHRQLEAQVRKQMEDARAKAEADRADAAGMKMEAPAVAETDESNAEAKPAEPIRAAETIVDPAGRRYITQPYTQLAAVYRAIGQDEQANDVLVARAERLGELAHPLSAQGLWYRYLGRLIGYGYEPFRAIKIGVVIIAVGTLIFALGAHRGLMAETNLAERVLSREDESGIVSPTYPRFNSLVYSLDVFLPFVDLNQVGYWIPGEKPSTPRKSRNCLLHVGAYSVKWSSVLHAYLWFQTLAGWTLCTLLAAAVTGIVQS